MTVSIASSKVAVAGRATIAVRGTITSWRRRWPSAMTALIICSSSASRIPCSPPRSTIRRSSSAVIWAEAVTSVPNGRVTARVTPVSMATIGLRMRPRTSTGAASVSAKRSGNARASVLGTSSANTMVNRASRTVTMISASPSAVPCSSPAPASSRERPALRLTAAKAEARKPMVVRPIWIAARKRPGSAISCCTRRAPGRPSSTSCSTRLCRIETRAISAATKNASSRVRASRNRISPTGKLKPCRPRRPIRSGGDRGSGRGSRPRASRAGRPWSPRHQRPSSSRHPA